MKMNIRAQYWALSALALVALTACQKESSLVNPVTAPAKANPDLVITPAGLMPRSSVHFIDEHHFLSLENGRIQKFEKESGRLVEDFGEAEITPVHNTSQEVQGWIAYAYWANTGAPITQFTTNWIVPSVPADTGGQTLFLFNGMQDGTMHSSYIIQPVLQFGPSAAGGGNFWAVTDWFVSSHKAFFGTLVSVNPGTSLQGVLVETGTTHKRYNYNVSFTGFPAASSIQVNGAPQAFWTAETLESYGVTSPATMYPPDMDIAMTGIQILTGPTNAVINWTPVQAVAGSAQRAVVVSDASPGGQVDLYFR